MLGLGLHGGARRTAEIVAGCKQSAEQSGGFGIGKLGQRAPGGGGGGSGCGGAGGRAPGGEEGSLGGRPMGAVGTRRKGQETRASTKLRASHLDVVAMTGSIGVAG